MITNFVYFGKCDSPNGAAVFFRSLIENRKKLEEKNAVNFYAQNLEVINDYRNVKSTRNNGLKKTIRNFIVKSSLKSRVMACLAFYIFGLRNAKKVIRQIKTADNTQQWVFNDVYAAYYFCKKFKGVDYDLILHNNGEPFKMILESSPKLAGWSMEMCIKKEIRKIVLDARKLIVLSENCKDILLDSYLELHNKNNIYVISNGISLPESNIRIDKKGIIVGVSVGSICNRKGFDMLVSANNLLAADDSYKIEIKCIGSIEHQNIIKQSKYSNLCFMGALSRQEISNYLHNADFFILCSRDEGMPLSIIEGMQCHLPIISTNVGAIPQMFENEEEGVLIEPSVEAIYDVLKKINNGFWDLKALGEKSYLKYANDFSLEKMIDRYKKILNL